MNRRIYRNRLAVRGIVRKGNKILLARRRKSDSGGGNWQFVGGKVEGGKPMDALRRELKEEANLKVRSAKRRHVQYNKLMKTHTYYYDVKVTGKPKFQKAELSAMKWVTVKQARNMPMTYGSKQIVRKMR